MWTTTKPLSLHWSFNWKSPQSVLQKQINTPKFILSPFKECLDNKNTLCISHKYSSLLTYVFVIISFNSGLGSLQSLTIYNPQHLKNHLFLPFAPFCNLTICTLLLPIILSHTDYHSKFMRLMIDQYLIIYYNVLGTIVSKFGNCWKALENWSQN